MKKTEFSNLHPKSRISFVLCLCSLLCIYSLSGCSTLIGASDSYYDPEGNRIAADAYGQDDCFDDTYTSDDYVLQDGPPEDMMPRIWRTAPYLYTGWNMTEAYYNDDTLMDDIQKKGVEMRIEFYNQYDAAFLRENGDRIDLRYYVDDYKIEFAAEDSHITAYIEGGQITMDFNGAHMVFSQAYTVDWHPSEQGVEYYIIYPLYQTKWQLVSFELDSGANSSTISLSGSIDFFGDKDADFVIGDINERIEFFQSGAQVSFEFMGMERAGNGDIDGSRMVVRYDSIADELSGTYVFEQIT